MRHKTSKRSSFTRDKKLPYRLGQFFELNTGSDAYLDGLGLDRLIGQFINGSQQYDRFMHQIFEQGDAAIYRR